MLLYICYDFLEFAADFSKNHTSSAQNMVSTLILTPLSLHSGSVIISCVLSWPCELNSLNLSFLIYEMEIMTMPIILEFW